MQQRSSIHSIDRWRTMKSLIVYFSQGGTTKRIAECIASGLREGGRHVDTCNLGHDTPPALEEYDSLGVGFPVYVFRPPFVVQDYLDSLPKLSGLPVFTFMLYGTYRGDAGNRAREVLREKGGREVGYLSTQGADYFFGYVKRGYLFSPDAPNEDQMGQAKSFGQEIDEQLQQGKSYVAERDEPPPWIHRLERFLTNRWFVQHMYSRLFRVKRGKCSSCGMCMKVCPTANITQDDREQPVWGKACLFCLYCEMKCPEEAIVSPVSRWWFGPFMRYNIWNASHDKTIDHVRVVHEKGRVSRRERSVRNAHHVWRK